MKLEDLKREEIELKSKLSDVRLAINAENLRIIEEKHGVRVGSVVLDYRGNEYMVTSIEDQWLKSKPSMRGNPRKKDGTFGIAERYISSNWTLVTS